MLAAEFAVSLFRAFYGRQTELACLVEAARKTRATGHGCVFLIEGEAGIGKSRLVSQLRVATRAERLGFLVGRSAEYLQAPYEPFVDALRGEVDAKSIGEALRAEPKRASSSEEERAKRFHLVENFLRKRAATRGVLVVVVEDLHWSDATSLDLFRHLAHRLDDTATVLIGTFRKAELDERYGHRVALDRMRHEGAIVMQLEPWSNEILHAAIHDALPERGALSEDLIRSICGLAEGVPFVAEELVREALGSGFEGAVPVAVSALSVRGHVHERLRTLSPKEQQVLMYAAVIGLDFDVALLAHLTQSSSGDVLEAIRKARTRHLVVEDPHSGRFRFRHALTQAILYRDLLITEARTLHERIANALEDGQFTAPIEKSAYHWWAARIPDRAIATNESAGDRALSVAAPADAARFYECALDFAPVGSENRSTLLHKVVQAHNAAGHTQSCLSWCERAVVEFRRVEDLDEALRFALRAAHQRFTLGDLKAARAAIEAVREELRSLPISGRHFSAELSLAMVLAAQGEPLEALAVLDRADALDCVRSSRERWRHANSRGSAYVDLGRFDDARAWYRQALDTAQESGEADLGVLALNNLAVIAMTVGEARLAKDNYDQALAAADRFGLRGERGMIVANLAQCELQLGAFPEAGRLAEQSVLQDYDRAAPSILGAAVALRLQTLCEVAKPRSDTWILDLIERALGTGSSELISATTGAAALALIQTDRPAAAAVVHRGLGWVTSLSPYWLFDAAAEVGEADDADRARGLLVTVGAEGENKAAAAHLALFDARTMQRNGVQDDAVALARKAHAAFQAMEWPVEAAAALEVAGDTALALRIYRQLGAGRQVRRLEDVLGRRRTPLGGAIALSRREEETARLIVRGYSNRTVAEELGIGERTVETHVASIYRKLGIKTRTELVARLSEQGL